ncbi:MAG: HigA family addiction module antidote protein [Magnetococcales bacterium]|nr:HigA family addiction module antidote protein [Magnetococcales bacterium]
MSTGEKIPPIHPGVHLEELLNELGLSPNQLARNVGVTPTRIQHILLGKKPVSAEMALRFGLFFGQSPEYWLSLQIHYDMSKAKNAMFDKLRQEVIPLHAA